MSFASRLRVRALASVCLVLALGVVGCGELLDGDGADDGGLSGPYTLVASEGFEPIGTRLT